MNFKLHKKFEGMEFRDLYELATMAARYERVILDKQEMENSSKGNYYKGPNLEVLIADYDVDISEIDMAELICHNPMVYKVLYKAIDGNSPSTIKKQNFKARKNYTFDISMADQIFDTLLAKKLIQLNSGHKMPKAEDLKWKEFCKWYNS